MFGTKPVVLDLTNYMDRAMRAREEAADELEAARIRLAQGLDRDITLLREELSRAYHNADHRLSLLGEL